jgi:hypothetical protein
LRRTNFSPHKLFSADCPRLCLCLFCSILQLIGQAKLELNDPNVKLGKRLGIPIDTGGVLDCSLRHIPMGDDPSAFVLQVAAKQCEELVFTVKPFHSLCWEFQVQEKNAEINFTAWHCAQEPGKPYSETELAWCMRPHR